MINGRKECWENFKVKGWFSEFKTYEAWFERNGPREKEVFEQLSIDPETESLEDVAKSEGL